MLLLKIDYTLGDCSRGTFGVSILNKNTKAGGRIQYSIEAESGMKYGSLDHYWAWSESLYSCAARIIHDGKEFLTYLMGCSPVEALTVSFAGTSPYGGKSKPVEMSRIAFSRTASGARITAEGKVCRGVWPIPMDRSNATLPWQIIFLCLLCDHVPALDFAVMPGPLVLPQLATTQEGTGLFMEDLPSGIEPWVRAYVGAFYPLALRRDGTVIDAAAWSSLEHPPLLYHRTAAIQSFDNILNSFTEDDDADSSPS